MNGISSKFNSNNGMLHSLMPAEVSSSEGCTIAAFGDSCNIDYRAQVEQTIFSICQAFNKIVVEEKDASESSGKKYSIKDQYLLASCGFKKKSASKIYNLVILLMIYHERLGEKKQLTKEELALTAEDGEMISRICMTDKPISVAQYAWLKGKNTAEIEKEWRRCLNKLSCLVTMACGGDA